MSSTDGWACTDASYSIDEIFEKAPWPATFWYGSVVAIAVINLAVFFFLSLQSKDKDENEAAALYQQSMRSSCGAYLAISLYRTVFLTTISGRWVWHDSVMSSVFFGRLLAAIAELCFVCQIVFATQFCDRQINEAKNPRNESGEAPPDEENKRSCNWHTYTQAVMKVMLVLIVAAECFSFWGMLTGNRMWFVIDQSCWLIAFLLTLPAFLHVFCHSKEVGREPRCCTAATAETFALCAFIFGVLYGLWIMVNSLPTWWSRYQWQKANELPVFPVGIGFWDALTFRVQTRDWAIWWRVVVWQPFCLTVVSWGSIAMSTAPRLMFAEEPAQEYQQSLEEAAPLTAVGVDTDLDGKTDALLVGVDRDRNGVPDALQNASAFVAPVGLDTNRDSKTEAFLLAPTVAAPVGLDTSRDSQTEAFLLAPTVAAPVGLDTSRDSQTEAFLLAPIVAAPAQAALPPIGASPTQARDRRLIQTFEFEMHSKEAQNIHQCTWPSWHLGDTARVT